MDIPREILETIPVFNGKPHELNQFLSTVDSFTRLYGLCRVDLVMLRTRSKAHKIISHTAAEDPDVKWSTVSKN